TNPIRIKSGTVFLNRAPGIQSSSTATYVVGDDASGNTATLRLGGSNEMASNANVTLASNGTFDLNNKDQVINTLGMEVGALGGSSVTLGTGTLTLSGATNTGVTVNAIGGPNATGASITGGTLALN